MSILLLPIIAWAPYVALLLTLRICLRRGAPSEGWSVIVASLIGGLVAALEWVAFQRLLDSPYAGEGAWMGALAIIAGAFLVLLGTLMSGFRWSARKRNLRNGLTDVGGRLP
jgi:hypothetical protein